MIKSCMIIFMVVTLLSGSAVAAIGETLERDDVIGTGPIVDVRAFGAIGDGYSDNRAAFQAANDFLVDGGTILVPKGKFVVAGPVNLSSNINVAGVGEVSIIRCRSMMSGFGAFVISGDNNVVRNLTFKGAAENVNGSTAVDVSGSDVTIENCVIEGFQNGLFISGSNVRVKSSSISGSDQNGVYIYSLQGGAVEANTISGCGSNGIYAAEDLPGGPGHNLIREVILSDNICASNGGSGIALNCGFGEIKLDNNVCRYNSAHGIEISVPESGVQDGDILVRNNSCFQNTLDGFLLSRLDQVAILHNRCYQNSGSGMVLSSVLNGNVSGNLLVENGSHGMKFTGTNGDESALIDVTGNVCFDNGDGSNDYGIYVEKYSEQIILTANSSHNKNSSNQVSGIRVENAATVNVVAKGNFAPNDKVGSGVGVVVQGPANSGGGNAIERGGMQAFEINLSTPSVYGGGHYYTQNSSYTTISSLTGGTASQVIKILFLDDKTTLEHSNTSIVLSNELDWSPNIYDSLTLINSDGRWLELGRSEK
jgi:Right handed beta helix region